jgi:hypothetical protein
VFECKSPKVEEPIAEAIYQLLRYGERRGASALAVIAAERDAYNAHRRQKMERNLRAQIEEGLRQKVREVRSQYSRGGAVLMTLPRRSKQFTDFVIYELLPPNRS